MRFDKWWASEKDYTRPTLVLELVDPTSGFTLIHLAAQRGNAKILEKLLESLGNQPLATTPSGSTPLHLVFNNKVCTLSIFAILR